MGKGAPKKYTPKTLKTALNRYFRSITCEETVKDLTGNALVNMDGQPVKETVYLLPPSVADICLRLGISKRTWENYAASEDPKMREVVEEARLRMEARLVKEINTRDGKDVRGVIFDLQNNYDWKKKQEVEIGAETRRAMGNSMGMEEKLRLVAMLQAMDPVEAGEDDGKADEGTADTDRESI